MSYYRHIQTKANKQSTVIFIQYMQDDDIIDQLSIRQFIYPKNDTKRGILYLIQPDWGME